MNYRHNYSYTLSRDILMTTSLPKHQTLKANATLNPHPEQIREALFLTDDFFDPYDLLQVKYEMLRRVLTNGDSVTEAAAAFGFSRPAFYQALSAFKQGGLAGLIPRKRGPKAAHKLSPSVMTYLQGILKDDPRLPADELAHHLEQHFGLVVHPRSIERALVRQKKKRSIHP